MPSLVLPGLLLALFVVLLAMSWRYPFEARLFPQIVLVPGIILLLWEIGRAVLKMASQKQPGATPPKAAAGEAIPARKVVEMAAWLAGFILVMYLFGLLIGIALFIFLYAKLNHARWLPSLLIPAVVLVFFYGFFAVFMKLYIYSGVLGELLASRSEIS